MPALALVGDARATLEALDDALVGNEVEQALQGAERGRIAGVGQRRSGGSTPWVSSHLPAQSEVLGAVNSFSDPEDVVVCAAGSMPGDLHKLWRTRDPKGYHVEYGYSCMGYEIAGGLGVKMAAPEREVYVMCGDGSYLMMNSEIVTSIQEGLKLTIVLVDNSGLLLHRGALALRRLGRLRDALPLPQGRLYRPRFGGGARQRPARRPRHGRREPGGARDPDAEHRRS